MEAPKSKNRFHSERNGKITFEEMKEAVEMIVESFSIIFNENPDYRTVEGFESFIEGIHQLVPHLMSADEFRSWFLTKYVGDINISVWRILCNKEK